MRVPKIFCDTRIDMLARSVAHPAQNNGKRKTGIKTSPKQQKDKQNKETRKKKMKMKAGTVAGVHLSIMAQKIDTSIQFY